MRKTLPDTKDLFSFAGYKAIVDLLGQPTHLPIGGETDDKWAYDTVAWRLFTPTGAGSIGILEVSVARKFLLGARNGGYLIESYSVSRGTLSKIARGGSGQAAIGPESKQEGNQKGSTKPAGRPR